MENVSFSILQSHCTILQECSVKQENRYHILMFSLYFPPQYSGAAKQALLLARQLRGMGHHVEFATVRWPDLAVENIVDGFAVHHLDQGRGVRHRELRLWWNLFRFLYSRRTDFDILHTHGAYYTNCIIGPLSRFFGLKSVAKASLADNDLHGVGRSLAGKIHRAFLRKIHACVATSRDLEREFLMSGVPRERVIYLPNGVDTERFRPAALGERNELRRKLGLPIGSPVALTVGVFDKRKNIGWLMEQWAQNNGFGTGSLLLAVGPRAREDINGSHLGDLHGLAARFPSVLKIQDHVENIELYYRMADLFILPSRGEGLPNVLLEAMACSLPCVASAVSGTQELMLHGETGWTFKLNDVHSLASAITKAATNQNPLLGLNGRKLIEERYSIKSVANKYAHLYSELLRAE